MKNTVRKKFGDIANLKRGYDLPAYKRLSGHYPVISSSGVSGYHSEFMAEGDGVITGRYGTLGEVYYISGKYWPHNTALYVTDFKRNDPKYVYFLLKYLGKLKTSEKSTVPGVNRNELHDMDVPYIQKSDQVPIADCLFKIEEKIELNNKMRTAIDTLVRTVYDYWFVQFDFPNDKGQPYKSSGGKMIYNSVLKRDIPDGWTDIPLSNIAPRIATGLNPRDNFKLGEGDNFYITIKNIEQGRIVIDDKCDRISSKSLEIINQRSDLRPGDILFTSIEPVGITYLVQEHPENWNINESVFSIRADRSKADPEYLFMLLSSDEMKAFTRNTSAGSIHKGIRHEILKSFRFAYSGPELAHRFAESIKPLLAQSYAIDLESQRLAMLQEWLMPMAMTGQVKVAP